MKLEMLLTPNSTSFKRSEKHISSKASFRAFLPRDGSNFRLKQCERP